MARAVVISKLLIVPYFGDLPPWFDLWCRNIERLEQHGYDSLITIDLEEFQRRVEWRLDHVCPITWNGSKIHDYRAAFAILFRDEIQDYEFWGTTDLDCVYGRPDHFVTDEFLECCDLHSDHPSYVCGPWALYRNTPEVNEAFMAHPDWKAILAEPETSGWVETEYTRIVRELLGDRMVNTLWQHRDFDDFSRASWGEDGALLEDGEERLLLHFRRSKVWPETLR